MTLSTNVANALTLIRDGNKIYDYNEPSRFIAVTGTATDSSTVWQFVECHAIGDGNGNYLQVTGTNTNSFGNTTSFANATKFLFIGTTTRTIATIRNNQVYYLGSYNNNLQVSNTSTAWTVSSDSIVYNNRNLRYNGTWGLQQPTTWYVLKNGDNYLGYSSNTNLTATTIDSNNLVLFSTQPGNNNTDVTVTLGNTGTTRYLYYNGDGSAITMAANSTNNYTNHWRYRAANGFHWYVSNNARYSVYYNGSNWVVSSTTPATLSTFETYTDPSFRISLEDGDFTDVTINEANKTYAQTINPSVASKDLTITATVENLTTVLYNPTFSFSTSNYSGVLSFDNIRIEMIYAIKDSISLMIDRSLSEQRLFTITSTVSGQPTGLTTFMPIRIPTNEDSDYDSNNAFKASLKNTGYIIGGGKYFENNNSVGDIRVSRYALANINSYANYKNRENYYQYLYTVTDDGNGGMTNRALTTNDISKFISFNDRTVVVKDENGEHNETYDGALTQFNAMITNYADGLHFMNAAISKNNIITVPQVTILKRNYYNYQLPGDCIDFKVLKRGAISFFAGEYFTGNNAFFSLHQIFRDNDQNISDIKEIQYVYKYKPVELGLADYIYLYKDGTYGRINQKTSEFEVVNYDDIDNLSTYYEIVFNTDWITNPTGVQKRTNDNQNRVYYFEIPCNKGEYALGSVDGKIGAYLLYLDIAANGGDEVESVVSGQENNKIPTFKVDFRSPKYENYEDEELEFAIIQLFINCPLESGAENREIDERLFSVNVVYDRDETGNGIYSSGIYNIYITNKIPGATAKISVFLIDNDDDIMTPFPYAYRIIYTNTENTNTIITNIADLDFYQSIGTFEIPSVGTASEVTY